MFKDLKSFLIRLKANEENQVVVPIFDRKLELSEFMQKLLKKKFL